MNTITLILRCRKFALLMIFFALPLGARASLLDQNFSDRLVTVYGRPDSEATLVVQHLARDVARVYVGDGRALRFLRVESVDRAGDAETIYHLGEGHRVVLTTPARGPSVASLELGEEARDGVYEQRPADRVNWIGLFRRLDLNRIPVARFESWVIHKLQHIVASDRVVAETEAGFFVFKNGRTMAFEGRHEVLPTTFEVVGIPVAFSKIGVRPEEASRLALAAAACAPYLIE